MAISDGNRRVTFTVVIRRVGGVTKLLLPTALAPRRLSEASKPSQDQTRSTTIHGAPCFHCKTTNLVLYFVGAQLLMPLAIRLDSYSETHQPICAAKPL